MVELCQPVSYCQLCFLTNGTGIQKNDIRIVVVGSCVKTMVLQNRRNNFTIREIHLTAIAFDIELSFLARDLRLGNPNSLTCLLIGTFKNIQVVDQFLHVFPSFRTANVKVMGIKVTLCQYLFKAFRIQDSMCF